MKQSGKDSDGIDTDLNSQIKDFVAGVLTGVIAKVVKSEPVPKFKKAQHVVQV